jgi:hypothetical protein
LQQYQLLQDKYIQNRTPQLKGKILVLKEDVKYAAKILVAKVG